MLSVSIPRAAKECGRVDCEPTWSWNPILRDFDLWVLLSGTGTAKIAGSKVRLQPGSLLFLRPGEDVEVRQDPGEQFVILYSHFDFYAPDGQKSTISADVLPSRHILLANTARIADSLTRVIRMSRDPNPLRQLERDAIFLQAVIEAYVQDAHGFGYVEQSTDLRIARVVEQIRARPSERQTLEGAANLAELSTSYFSRLFSDQLGMSFREFLLQTRLERAYDLLTQTTMTTSEIARVLGYPDLFLFSRQVRKHFGQSPKLVRAGGRGALSTQEHK